MERYDHITRTPLQVCVRVKWCNLKDVHKPRACCLLGMEGKKGGCRPFDPLNSGYKNSK